MDNTKPKRLTLAFNRASVTVGENFEVLLPSSESDGYVWTLNDPSRRLQTTATKAFPDWEPRARMMTLAATEQGVVDFQVELRKPGTAKARQVYKFKVAVK